MRASHILGGEITWKCQGNSYIFELIFYRDCNGSDVSVTSEMLKVWGHPTVTSIPVTYLSRIDISPACTQVGGGAAPFACGAGASGGNGLGAIEKVTYQSAPIALSGTAPASGWIFTYENSFRSSSITNLTSPATAGSTIVAKMFPISGALPGCYDSSPKFLQDPYFVSCAGDNYQYNGHAVDIDLDSIVFSWGNPLNYFPAQTYNGTTIPAALAFDVGFSANSPTPDASFNPLNSAAFINPSSGEITFKSFTLGNYTAKIIVTSFRQGQKIAEVERETQFFVTVCNPTNTQPDIIAPFPLSSWTTTVLAGDPVTFNLVASDLENLQDGTPQSITFTGTSLQFGTNFTSALGCANPPCAVVSNTLPYTVSQNGVLTFNWQTDCSHVISPQGIGVDFVDYQFVFKVQDNYCPVPRVTYASVIVRVKNRNTLPAIPITCITGDYTNNFSVNWLPVVDPLGTSFFAYTVEDLNTAVTGTINSIGSTSYSSTNTASGILAPNFELSVLSGCNGTLSSSLGSIKAILLKLNNPSNGTAILNWNDPIVPKLASMGNYYHIYREYPIGTWVMIDSVPYGTNFYRDTIDICSAFLNYQIVLPNSPCNFTSNIEGDNFVDMITPTIPILNFATIDTLTNLVTISWNQNNQEDTYGYIVYGLDVNGFLVEIDTVWGLGNTTYTYSTATNIGPLQYSIAAFDSCFTPSIPPTYQTSAKGDVHITHFTSATSNPCLKQITVNWTPYQGLDPTITYTIFAREIGQSWQNKGTSVSLDFTFSAILGATYEIVVQASSPSSSFKPFGNKITHFVKGPASAAFNYLTTATVVGSTIEVKSILDNGNGVSKLILERLNTVSNLFEEIATIDSPLATNTFVDVDVDVDYVNYTYRWLTLDSCGADGIISNQSRTNVLKYQKNEVEMKILLSWTGYSGFNGPLVNYAIYRSIDGIFSTSPIAIVTSNRHYYEDDVSAYFNSNGEFCYYVVAIEGGNVYNFSETSHSNTVCPIIQPLIYVPNAFTPGGSNNPIFIPIISLASPNDYIFTIFNRWGQVVFQTRDMSEGWDGSTPNSKEAQEATYVYVVSVRDGGGTEIQKRGTVTLLRF